MGRARVFRLRSWLLTLSVVFALASADLGRAGVKIGGIDYTDARDFFGHYGLDVKAEDGGSRLVFSSRWTKIVLEADHRDVELNGLRVFLGEAVATRSGSLYVATIDADKLFAPILRANELPNPKIVRVVAIDAGHGGNDSGTTNAKFKLLEKTYTLEVAKRLEAKLTAVGYKVVMTRTDDRYVALEERSAIANRAGADLFISIHFNAVENASSVRGSETYSLTPQYQRSTSSNDRAPGDAVAQPGNASDPWNALLAYCVHREVLEHLKSFDRGMKRARFAVLKYITCPGVLVEAGYISNDDEGRKIASAAYQDRIAESIAAAVADYAAAVKRAATH